MTSLDSEGAISVLRWAHILGACRDGPTDRTTIVEQTGCSRSTAYRATSDLVDRGLLERADRGYRLTGAGRAMLDHSRRFLSNIEGTEQIRPLFEYVDAPALIRQAHLFTDAEVVTQDGSTPYRIETRMKEIISGTQERMTGISTGLGSPALAEAMLERIRAGVSVEWILPEDMYEQFTEGYGQLSSHGPVDVHTAVSVYNQVPVNLAMYDETLVLLGFDHERGILGTVAITDESDAIQWARTVFDDCCHDAEQVE